MLVSEILRLYMESIKHKATYKVDLYFEARFNALYGALTHSELTVVQLNNYRDQRLTEVATGSVRRELSLIKRAWRYCLSEGYELTNLFDIFRMPPSGKTVRRVPTERELKALKLYCSPQVSALISLGIETCMRRGELLNIQKQHVDFYAKTLYIPKAKCGPRTIPLSKKALRILKANDYQFTIKASSVSSNIYKVCKRLEIEGLCFHAITRHYGTTRLIERGFSVSEAATVTGHSDPTTLHRYTHLNLTLLANKM